MFCSGTAGAQEHAAGALANLSNGHPSHQSLIGDAGALPPILALLAADTAREAESATRDLSRGASAAEVRLLLVFIVVAISLGVVRYPRSSVG